MLQHNSMLRELVWRVFIIWNILYVRSYLYGSNFWFVSFFNCPLHGEIHRNLSLARGFEAPHIVIVLNTSSIIDNFKDNSIRTIDHVNAIPSHEGASNRQILVTEVIQTWEVVEGNRGSSLSISVSMWANIYTLSQQLTLRNKCWDEENNVTIRIIYQ